MARWTKAAATATGLALVAGLVTLSVITRQRAHELVTNPAATRTLPGRTPADYGMAGFQDVSVTTDDGLRLAGWFVPPANGAVVILQHGYKANRGEMLNEAAMLHAHGYGVLLMSVRAHDRSDGELITFGVEEMRDFDAWFRFARSRNRVDPNRIALLGNSLGATMAIQFAARTPQVRAVVANSAFSSLEDTIETSIRFFTGLPPFPFAPMIAFWAEREAGFSADAIDAKTWIAALSPRPVLLMQGGSDSVISADSGQRLYDAAGEPKELWFDPDVRHAAFDTARTAEYERRVTAFFSRYLGSGLD
jgi:dipeptidyl aminopeptidase/acylaminoacyl peptidase